MEIKYVIRYINACLDEGRKVRIHENLAGGFTAIYAGTECIEIPGVIIYPGYLNLTKPGTPSRVIAMEDQGLFGAEHLKGVRSYLPCMSHTYNEHDGPWEEDHDEDAWLDGSYEES